MGLNKIVNRVLDGIEQTDPLKNNPALAMADKALGGQGPTSLPTPPMASPAPVVITAPPASPVNVATPMTENISAPKGPADNDLRRRAAALSGSAGVRIPPVGVRGSGAVPRTAILGR